MAGKYRRAWSLIGAWTYDFVLDIQAKHPFQF